MTPFEKLNAVAARLIQEGNATRDKALAVRLKEAATTIRGAAATIRNAIASPEVPASDRARYRLIMGDENHG